jgi:hypothetical protein
MPRLSNLKYNYHVVKFQLDKNNKINEDVKLIDKYYSQLTDIQKDLKDLTYTEIKYLSKNYILVHEKPKYKGLYIMKIKPFLKYGLESMEN